MHRVVPEILYRGPSYDSRFNSLPGAVGQIEEGNAFRSEQKFVCARGERIHEIALHVELECTETLDGINHKQNVAFTTESSDPLEIESLTSPKLNPTERQDTCSVVDKGEKSIDFNSSTSLRLEAQFNSVCGSKS